MTYCQISSYADGVTQSVAKISSPPSPSTSSPILSNLVYIERYGVIYLAPFVAFRISCATSYGCDTDDAWLDASETVGIDLFCEHSFCSWRDKAVN